jgi:hypothetical protein
MSDESGKSGKKIDQMLEQFERDLEEVNALMVRQRTNEAIHLAAKIFPMFTEHGVMPEEGIFALLYNAAAVAYRVGLCERTFNDLVQAAADFAIMGVEAMENDKRDEPPARKPRPEAN